MRILDRSEQDAQIVSLGDELTMIIQLVDPSSSAFALSAQNLYARGSNGESLYLIDNHGYAKKTINLKTKFIFVLFLDVRLIHPFFLDYI